MLTTVSAPANQRGLVIVLAERIPEGLLLLKHTFSPEAALQLCLDLAACNQHHVVMDLGA